MHIKLPTPSHVLRLGKKDTIWWTDREAKDCVYLKLCGLESKSFEIVARNLFEEDEDVRIYLRNTLKQDSMSFEEYNLFAQKKEKS